MNNRNGLGKIRPWLGLDDEALLAQCQTEATRGTGPGGQKRNKTSSAIRLVHKPTGIAVRAEDSRSQKLNRRNALQRLRLAIALAIRCPPVECDFKTLRPREPEHVARVIDQLEANGYVISDAAQAMLITTGALSGFICKNEAMMAHVNAQRALQGLRPLRAR